mmetsp:Transcript_7785/g.17968  ORF Transcript_7785/g.17968 Transcript_7785/m.17968 type:complete len:629 (+) Transcript_7785:68-1954(+)
MRGQAEIGLHLPPIQTTRPRVPEEDAASSPRSPASGGGSPRNLCLPDKLKDFIPSKGPSSQKATRYAEMSAQFQSLLHQLVDQYCSEMGAMELEVEDLKEMLNSVEGEVIHLRSENNILKSAGNSPRDFSERVGSTVGDAFKAKHMHMKEMKAEEILTFLEEKDEKDSVEKLFEESDFKKLIKKSHTRYVPSETAEERAERLAKMSRLEKVRDFLQSNLYEMIMATILCVNVLWMAFELQFRGLLAAHETSILEGEFVAADALPAWETVIAVGDIFFTVIFVADVATRVCLLGVLFWKSWMNYVDLGVSVTSLIELTVFYATTMPVNPVLFRLLRIGKLARAFRMVHMTSVLASLQLLVKCLLSSANMLFWSFLLLTFVQCVAGLVISTLCFDYITDGNTDDEVRRQIYMYYGTFSRTFLTMFEVMFANWGPPCRVLMESVSEWFGLFFLFYRCVLGFAVLNIINAVFVQQTMKTASSDEEIAFKQKEKDIATYTRKVKKLFQTMDASGDGAINLTEFAKLVQSPKLKFWMGQLELEYHDLLSLFEFLDNGDGEITLMEFIDGAARLRGSAKALDIWRMETKLEVLFEEVLNKLNPGDTSRGLASVQNVFNNSSYRHIKTTQMVRQHS